MEMRKPLVRFEFYSLTKAKREERPTHQIWPNLWLQSAPNSINADVRKMMLQKCTCTRRRDAVGCGGSSFDCVTFKRVQFIPLLRATKDKSFHKSIFELMIIDDKLQTINRSTQ